MRAALLSLLGALVSAGLPAQVHTLISERPVTIRVGAVDHGTLTYSIYLDGGRDAPGNRYVFDGQPARLRVVAKLTTYNRRWRSRLRIGIGSYRSLAGEIWDAAEPPPTILLPDAAPVTLTFETTRPGMSNFVLPFSVLDANVEGWDDPAAWDTSVGEYIIVAPQFGVEGVPTPEDRRWARISGSLPELVAYVREARKVDRYYAPALEAIAAIVEPDYDRYAAPGSSAASVEAFVRKYTPYEGRGAAVIDERLRTARAYAAELGEPDEADEPASIPEPVARVSPGDARGRAAAEAWRAAVGSRDTTRLRAYLRDFAGVIPRYDSAALDSIACWPVPSYRVLDRRGERERIQLVNFTAPAYYDVYGPWVDIDDRQLLEQQLLSLAVKRSERLSLRIVDKACPTKEVVIPIDNIMSAELAVDTLAGVYRFRFRGGSPPYRLRLTAAAVDGEGEWSRGGITAERYVVTEDSLQAVGLSGYYAAEAYSDGSDTPVAIAGTLFVAAAPAPAWLWPTLLVLALGGLALLVLFVLRQGRTSQRTVFEE